MSLSVEGIEPLAKVPELLQLFRDNGEPLIADFIQRAYPVLAKAGARSWIGHDAAGRVVMHIARFRHTYQFGTEELAGGLLGNLMVDAAHRTFFPAMSLVRRLVEETRRSRAVDFLYADPHNGAPAVLKAAGFRPLGTLRRFILPVSDHRAPISLALSVWHGARGMRAAARDLPAEARPASAFAPTWTEVPAGVSNRLRPVRPADWYRNRLGGFPSARDWWMVVDATPGGSPAVAALVRGVKEPAGLFTLCALHRDPSLAVRTAVAAILPALRERGCTRLQIWTMSESEFAAELRAAGFSDRFDDDSPVVVLPITERGEEVAASPAMWETTHIDYDR